MKFWLITEGEPSYLDGGDRLHRTGMLAEYLSEQGHQVDWWSSTFDHFRKTHRFPKDENLDHENGVRLHFLRSPGYPKNVCLQRFKHNKVLARRFREVASERDVPDVIVCSMPPIELAEEAVRYARKQDIPVYLDLRDMWPDIFLTVLPGPARPIGQLMLLPLANKLRWAAKNATGLIGITEEFLDWGLGYAGRAKNPNDAVFPHAYVDHGERTPPHCSEFWKSQGIRDSDFVICLFSIMSRKLDLAPVFAAAKELNDKGTAVKFVLCGNGDELERFRNESQHLPNVLFPGWVGRDEILSLMSLSAAGIAPFAAREDFRCSIPNKIVEYLSRALPILSNLTGSTLALMEKHSVGRSYQTAEDLVREVLFLKENPETLARYGQEARRLFLDQFVADKVLLRYANTISQPPSKASAPLGVLSDQAQI